MKKINWVELFRSLGDESNAAKRYEIQRQVEHCAECKRLHKATITCEECQMQGGDK